MIFLNINIETIIVIISATVNAIHIIFIPTIFLNTIIIGTAIISFLNSLIIKLYVAFPNAWNVAESIILTEANTNPIDRILNATTPISTVSFETSNAFKICAGNRETIIVLIIVTVTPSFKKYLIASLTLSVLLAPKLYPTIGIIP